MTQDEMRKIFEGLGIKEGVGRQSKTGKHTIELPEQKRMAEILKSMKGIFQQQLAKEELELANLKEALVKAKKGGSNG